MDETSTSSFGQNLRKYRKIKGWTQDKLATECGLSSNYISDLETSKKQPSYETVKTLAGKLEISLDQISYGQQTSSDDYYIKEAMMLRSKMSDEKKKVADRLGLKILEEILDMPDI